MKNRIYVLLPTLAIVLLSTTMIPFGSFQTAYSKNPTNPTGDTIKGTIGGNTNNGNTTYPAWIVGGVYKLSNINSTTYPTFNATFYMIKIDGTANHTHSIYDFKLTGQPTADSSNNSTTIYNGTSTVTMRGGPVTNVPTQINLLDDHAISITLDRSMLDNHFGSAPIFGTQHLICVEHPNYCQ